MMAEVHQAEIGTDVAGVCSSLGLSRATFYRQKEALENPKPAATRPKSFRALTGAERNHVLDVLHEERFMDLAPAQVFGQLMDLKIYLCSISTMYRILNASKEVRERRNQLVHPIYKKPELLATGPNQVWSWDITKLRGPVKGTFFQLYVFLDIFSRYVVGWLIAPNEDARLAQLLIEESCIKQSIQPGTLTVHSDRGTSMTSKTLALLYADLGINQTTSRPYVSDDNPFSEAQFKTLKYRPQFPERFGSIEDARAFCQWFFSWYNGEHLHSGLALLTPETVHYGRAKEVIQKRNFILTAAYAKHPERFVRRPPVHASLRPEVWINPPVRPTGIEGIPH